MKQPDLFEDELRAAEAPSHEMLVIIRARLHETLALVTAAETMPWTDTLKMIHADNGFRSDKDALPPEKGAALWAAFDREMDRLYARLNADAAAAADPAA